LPLPCRTRAAGAVEARICGTVSKLAPACCATAPSRGRRCAARSWRLAPCQAATAVMRKCHLCPVLPPQPGAGHGQPPGPAAAPPASAACGDVGWRLRWVRPAGTPLRPLPLGPSRFRAAVRPDSIAAAPAARCWVGLLGLRRKKMLTSWRR
jgi:hypothetical protein